MDEVENHCTPNDCWLVLCDKVYDLTEFHVSHPGGSAIITGNAGKNATELFLQVHPSDLAERLLSPNVLMGIVDKKTVQPHHISKALPSSKSVDSTTDVSKVGLNHMLNSFDFEAEARNKMGKEGWAYYSSGADDEITLRENHNAFHRIWLKPRILVNVKSIDTSTRILGFPASLPLYISATALAKLAHPDGEMALVKAAHKEGIHFMMPTLSSCSVDEMLDAREPGQIVFSQLYVNQHRERTREYVAKCERSGVKALFITVDAPQLGRREKDLRNKLSNDITTASEQKEDVISRNEGVTRSISTFIDPSLCWDDLSWFFESTKLPIYLKGVQCSEDALLAFRYGCSGVVLSNHGGRQLDLSRSGIEILPEVMNALRKEPGYSCQTFQVFVDGGIRRGADIFKAIALGATAVGIGRPSIYSLAAFGPAGVSRMIQIFKEELEMCMRLMGTPNINSIHSDHVITKNLADHFAMQPRDSLLHDIYEPLKHARTYVSKM